MLNSCGNSIVFAVEDPDAAKYLSEKIGDTEVSYVEESQSMGPENVRDGFSQSRREKTKKLVMPSELHQLKDYECYLKLRNYDWTKTKTSIKDKAYPDINEPFKIRAGLNLDSVIREQEKIKMEAREKTNNFSAPQYPPSQQKKEQRENEQDREKEQENSEPEREDGINW
ncbi:MAG: type IV secretion system DNA-binding domain-containing protein [Nitrospinae bacterium]|nr:type IV secretion system DNA-binding domain-containing protein [Nitrospinota bacterium]